METDERVYVTLEELVTGLVVVLRMRGIKWLELGDRTQDAVVVAGRAMEADFNEAGITYDFVLNSHPIYGGSGAVADAFRAPSMWVILQRWTGERAVELKFSEDMAERILEDITGDRTLYEKFTERVLVELGH